MTPPQLRDEAVLSGSSYYNQSARTARRAPELKAYSAMKRLMDIAGSAIGLFLLSPLLVLIAILIKLEDPKGPILFKQTRIGKNGKTFQMYKLRSMVVNAEEKLAELLHKNEINGAMFKMKDDPRITRVGKFIRKTSLDELPQLLNVLRGEMSLVGPRPPLGREVAEYTEHDKKRLSVTPGCTGLWQVSGRNKLSFDEMVELDIAYIEQRSLLLDMKILVRTVKEVVAPQNAF
ncbi:sugar transferase [Paenibacillus sp. HB172176]|uniref:sugar transferase n=1 Tax=Paenibacillus sp. HB172176 TaxID=2493690 RepID=UPI00143C1ACD|nr:sugar transferase [Paenibacillus sp. HB172176]